MVNARAAGALKGDPTAAWMEQALAQALPRALGPHLAPGDRGAPVLEVRIDWIYLGPSSGGTGPAGCSQDTVVGSFIVGDRAAEWNRKCPCGRSRFITRWRWSGPGRAGLSRARCRSRPGFRRLGAEGARALKRARIGCYRRHGLNFYPKLSRSMGAFGDSTRWVEYAVSDTLHLSMIRGLICHKGLKRFTKAATLG